MILHNLLDFLHISTMVFIKSICFYFHCGLDDVWMLICLVFVEDIGRRQDVTSLSVFVERIGCRQDVTSLSVFVESIGHGQDVTSLSVFHLEPCLCTNLLSCVCGEYWLQTGRHLLVCVSPRTMSLYKPFVLCLWRVLVTDRTSPPCLCFA